MKIHIIPVPPSRVLPLVWRAIHENIFICKSSILSRSKTANMGALFPCGDNMVCIIDDRYLYQQSFANFVNPNRILPSTLPHWGSSEFVIFLGNNELGSSCNHIVKLSKRLWINIPYYFFTFQKEEALYSTLEGLILSDLSLLICRLIN
jgi:hypothetical protein